MHFLSWRARARGFVVVLVFARAFLVTVLVCSLVEVLARNSRAIRMLTRASGVAGRRVRVRARGLSVVLLARLLLLVFWLR